MKRCKKCGVEKDFDCFYKEARSPVGYAARCKECCKTDARANRVSRLEYYREYDRRRQREDPGIKRRHQEALVRHALKYPQKYKARVMLARAVRRGTVVPKNCELCDVSDTVAHHTDYSKPLDVRWLCRRCHYFIHAPLLLPYYPEAA